METRKRGSKMKSDRIIVSSSSEVSTNSSELSDSPIKKFNRILRSSVARHWSYFKKERATLRERGRSVSDAGLCSIIDHDRELVYIDIPRGLSTSRQSLRTTTSTHLYHKSNSVQEVPTFDITSAGGGSHVGIEEASDSDAERPRRSHHLRVPTPAYVGQSTGNFGVGSAGGGCGVPRSAPATPLQLEPQPRHSKHDKQAIKPLSGSAPSVRVVGLNNNASGGEGAKDGKQPSKSRQKKFQRHFPQVGPEERVLNYYSCALVGDLLLQGHLYITKNYFAFYSNVFGYVTKLLIPTTSVVRISKEKVARIIPNAVGVCTRDDRHVFGSLLSRDAAYRLMTHVWKSARDTDTLHAQPQCAAGSCEPSEYSPEEDSSSAAGDPPPDSLIAAASAAVIQPALLTRRAAAGGAGATRPGPPAAALCVCALLALAALSALYLACRLYLARPTGQEWLVGMSNEEVYSELVQWRSRVHGRTASELHSFLTTNLMLLSKVRQSLEALSGVIMTDMAHNSQLPADTVYS